jgi:8-oxo-dGTP pyrophosphatase MutT (NUDIX family)
MAPIVGAVEDRVEAPGWLADHAEAFRASGAVPAVPRLAATVVLLRDNPAGRLELYVQRRAATMAFAPGMYAFPGGSVDPADYSSDDVDIEFDARMGLPAQSAGAVRRAAVRELVEEAGVRLGVNELHVWARWLTPEFEPRRYDTFFFVADMPAGQRADGEGIESDHSAWLVATDALRLPMLPPTRRTVGEMARYPHVAAVLAAAAERDVSVAVRPEIEVDAEGVWLRLG